MARTRKRVGPGWGLTRTVCSLVSPTGADLVPPTPPVPVAFCVESFLRLTQPYKPATERWMKSHQLNAASAADTFCALLLDEDLGESTRQQVDALTESGGADALLAALQVLLQSPEYQLA